MPQDRYDQEMQKMYNELVKAQSDSDKTSLPIICPTTYNKPCRLCDLCKNILFKRDNEGTPVRAKAGELNRKHSYYSNVIFPTNPSEIIPFQYGTTIWKDLMLFQMSPTSEIKDWLDPRTGRNVIITKTVVAGNKRRTTYSTKSRINASPLLDMAVLKKLSLPESQLDNIIDLIKAGKVKPFYQSQLQDGPNELRFLPSWLGPGITKFFQLVLYHYGVTEEEFEQIQKGELNPLAGLDYEVQKPIPIPEAGKSDYAGGIEAVKRMQTPSQSIWEGYLTGEQSVESGGSPIKISSATEPADPQPVCFGKKYDPNDDECEVDCRADGWTDACKAAYEALQRSSMEKRKTAKRLAR
jgi:hypothetical protein